MGNFLLKFWKFYFISSLQWFTQALLVPSAMDITKTRSGYQPTYPPTPILNTTPLPTPGTIYPGFSMGGPNQPKTPTGTIYPGFSMGGGAPNQPDTPTAPPNGCGSGRTGRLEPNLPSGDRGSWGDWISSTSSWENQPPPMALKSSKTIYDLGCGNGFNSIHVVKTILRFSDDKNFTYVCVDRPENNWQTTRSSLQTVLTKVFPKDEGTESSAFTDMLDTKGISSLSGPKGILMSKSFYGEVAPADSVDLFFSYSAMHYLSDLKNIDQRAQANMDWLKFLVQREQELKIDGKMYITAFATKEAGKKPGEIWNTMNRVLSEAADKGLITKEERLHWRFAAWPRTENEWRFPFDKQQVKGLKLENFEIVEHDSPFWLLADNDACSFVDYYVSNSMIWLGNFLGTTLNKNVQDLFRSRLTEDISSNPRRYKKDRMQAVMMIRKIPKALPPAPPTQPTPNEPLPEPEIPPPRPGLLP